MKPLPWKALAKRHYRISRSVLSKLKWVTRQSGERQSTLTKLERENAHLKETLVTLADEDAVAAVDKLAALKMRAEQNAEATTLKNRALQGKNKELRGVLRRVARLLRRRDFHEDRCATNSGGGCTCIIRHAKSLGGGG